MKKIILFSILIYILILSTGCKTVSKVDLNSYTPMQMENYVQQIDPDKSIEQIKELTGIISLEDAMDASLKVHPDLAAAYYNIKSFDGTIQQAGTLPNPSLSGEIEEFGGSGEFSGSGAMSSRFGISQEIPLGGKISRRVKVARVQKSIAESEYSAQFLALRTEIKKSFLRVYFMQEQLKLEEEKSSILSSLKEAVAKKVHAGEVSPLDEVKATVQLESAAIGIDRVKRELEGAKHVLAALWGEENPKFEKVNYAYKDDFIIPDEQTLIYKTKFSPTYSILNKNVTLASNKLGLARAEAWVDIEVGGGVQRFNETDDHAYFLEVSIPLPIFNRNKGNIEEAIQTRNMMQKEFEAGKLELRTDLRELIKKMQSIQKAYSSMEKSVMPAAEKAYNSVKKSYEAGEEDYLELLDAQRTYLDAKQEYLELFNEFQELKIDIEFLTGEKKGEKS